ncbi:hypothetical protein [Methylobacterium gregans]
MTLQAHVRFTPVVEDVKPDEGETIEQLSKTFDAILERVSTDTGRAV